jgi:hypothetical protein
MNELTKHESNVDHYSAELRLVWLVQGKDWKVMQDDDVRKIMTATRTSRTMDNKKMRLRVIIQL